MRTTDLIKKSSPFALAAACLLGGAAMSELLRATPALAQSDGRLPPNEVLNAAEQRRQQTLQFQQINERLGRIEAALNSGLKVKVIEMPPVIMKDPVSGK